MHPALDCEAGALLATTQLERPQANSVAATRLPAGRRIAEALGMAYVFLCEFEELWSPARDAASQGGGVHGNALLSRFDMSDARVIQHRRAPLEAQASWLKERIAALQFDGWM